MNTCGNAVATVLNAVLNSVPFGSEHRATEEHARRVPEAFYQEQARLEEIASAPEQPPQRDSALARQEGGDHYKKHAIQPVEYIHRNNIGFCEGNVIKLVTRWRDKGGIGDLEKAKHFIELLIELEATKETF